MGNYMSTINRKEALRRNLTITSQSKKKYLTEANSLKSDQAGEARPELTEKQKQLVLQSWVIVQANMDGVVVLMFTQGLALNDVTSNTLLRSHAYRVMAIVDKCIESIHEPQALEKLLCDLGSRHVTFPAKVDYLDLIGPKFISAVEGVCSEQWTPAMEHAWAALFKLITHIMKAAMQL